MRFIEYLQEQALLLEARIDFIKAKFKGVSTAHDDTAEHHDSDAIVDHFASKADPTPNKIHTQWIMGQYKAGAIKQADHERIHATLSNFNRYKNRLEKKSITDYSSLSHIEDAIAPHLGGDASNKEAKKRAKLEGAEVIHSDNGVTVHKITTRPAALLYGKNTKWCTASDDDPSYCEHYLQRGPLFVIHHDGKKYQFHNESGEMETPEKLAVDLSSSEVHPDIAKSLSKSNHPAIRDFNVWAKNPHITAEDVGYVFANGSMRAKYLAAQHPDLPSKHIDAAIHDKDYTVRGAVAANPSLSHAQIDVLVNDEENHVRERLADHPNLSSDHLHTLLRHGDFAAESALSHPNITVDHLNTAITNSMDDYTIIKAVRHPLHTADHIDKAMQTKSPRVMEAAVVSPYATTEHIKAALNHDDDWVNVAAAAAPNITHEQLDRALKSRKSYVREAAINNPNITADHLHVAIRDSHIKNARTASRHPLMTPEHITRFINDTTVKSDIKNEVVDALLTHNNHYGGHHALRPEHISQIINSRNISEGVKITSLITPAATHEVLSDALNHETSWIRRTAIKHMISPSPDQLEKAMTDHDPDVRYQAYMTHGHKATREQIERGLDDPDADVAAAANYHASGIR